MADKHKTKGEGGKTEPMATGDKDAAKDSGENAAPQPDAPTSDPAPPDPRRPDPTRYGDWEINGRCIDF